MNNPINNINLFYGYDKERTIAFLKESGFRFCAKVTSLPNDEDRYQATTHPLCIDYTKDEDEMLCSIFPTDYEPFEYQLLKEEIERHKDILKMIQEELGCNYMQLTNRKYLQHFLEQRQS